METIHHLLTSLNFIPSLIHVFTLIADPVAHEFKEIGTVLFTGLKKILETNPSLISGTIFISMVYAGYSFLRRPKRKAIPVSTKKV